jgi:CII-binding regulator of phage lambda lysogenization HflD
MYLERTMDELERNLDNVNSYFVDLRDQVERELKDHNDEIAQLKDDISTLEEQNTLLEEQLEELKYEYGMINLELIEVTGQLIQARHEK